MFESLPRRLLEELEPGPVTAAFLSAVDVDELSGYDRVVALTALQRLVSHLQARLMEAMAAVCDAYDDGDAPFTPAEAGAAEIRAALHLTRRAADADVGLALELRRLPDVLGSLAAGRIDVRRARTIVFGVGHLPDDAARQLVESIIDDAATLTTGQLAARLRRLCLEVDPEEAQRRHEKAVEERRVVTEATVDGAANLMGLDLPPDRVAEAASRIDAIARSLRGGGETRSMDQLRADVYLDLLCGAQTSRRGGVIELRVDLATLAELSDAPADLAGYGPIVADIARRVAATGREAQWRYTVTDQGRPVATGTTKRRPTTGLRRSIEAAHPTCVFPGCRMPATGCDLDHQVPWSEGGPTRRRNLAPVCRHDHRIRHLVGWTHRTTADGTHRWTSPLGHTYVTSGTPP